MTEQLTSIQLLSIVVILMVSVNGIVFFLLSKLKKQLVTQELKNDEELRSLKQHQGKLSKQFVELRSVSTGLNKQILAVNDQIEVIQLRLSELEHTDSEGRFYSRATKMVQMGADLDELIEECELPKAEAELMITLQNKLLGKKDKRTSPAISNAAKKHKSKKANNKLQPKNA